MKKDFDTRKNKPNGILWHGLLYESIPALGDTRVAIVEEGDGYLIVQEYENCDKNRGGVWWLKRGTDALMGQPHRIPLIGMGRPTQWRIDKLKDAFEKEKRSVC